MNPQNNNNQKKILLTGASGFLGFHFMKTNPDLFIAQYNANNPKMATSAVCINWLENNEYLMEESENWSAIIHLAAYANTNLCEKYPDLSFQLNVKTSEFLANIASQRKIPFVFTSTDLVFDGKKGKYSESDVTCPINIYGNHKALAEEAVLKVNSNSLIVRLSMMCGLPQAAPNSYLPSLFLQLKNNNKQQLFIDEFRSAAGAACVTSGILSLCGKKSGLLHMGGPERLSRLEIGELVCDTWGFDKNLLEKVKQSEISFPAARPSDVSMDSSKAFYLGYKPKSMKDVLKELKESYLLF